MNRKIPVFAVLLTFVITCGLYNETLFAQSAADVLEQGQRIGKKIYFGIEGKSFVYDADGTESPTLLPVRDPGIFLTTETGAEVYFRALNPLGYSVQSTQEFVPDKAEQQASDALQSIISSLSGVIGSKQQSLTENNKNIEKLVVNKKLLADKLKPIKGKLTKAQKEMVAGIASDTTGIDNSLAELKSKRETMSACMQQLKNINDAAVSLSKDLENDHKKEIADIFLGLKALDFSKAESVKEGLADAKIKRDKIQSDYFDDIKQSISNFIDHIKAYGCDDERAAIDKFVLALMVDKFQQITENQLKRLHNLDSTYNIVKREYDKCVTTGTCLYKKLDLVIIKSGQVSGYTINVSEGGYDVKDNEIVKTENKLVASYSFKVKTFRKFVIELAAGLAFTDITYPNYVTGVNAAGQQVVAAGDESNFSKVKVTTMLNFNYFVSNSQLIPFFQLGVGANSAYPALFTGVGIRVNTQPARRLAFSVGFASTWVKTLSTLKIDSVVTSQADIDKDIKYEFHWPLKPYFGIQYNF